MQRACYANLGQNVEASSISQSNVSLHQTMLSRGGQNQAVPPIVISFRNSHVPNRIFSNYHDLQPSRMSAPSCSADPLLTESEKIQKEIRELKKNPENMITMLKSDCEKEIQEIVAEIRKKYEMKQQDTQAEFKLKEDEFSKNMYNILKNKMLSEALRRKCLPHRPPGHPTQGLAFAAVEIDGYFRSAGSFDVLVISVARTFSEPLTIEMQSSPARPYDKNFVLSGGTRNFYPDG